jgi:hypothetical protein
MLLDSLVEIPDVPGKIVRKKIKGTVYIYYEYARSYDPERQFNIPKRTTIGKAASDDPTKMIPNSNYLRYFSHLPLPEVRRESWRSSCLRIGPHLVISKVVEHYGLGVMLERLFGDDAPFLLDLASYSIICENNAGQYYPDWAFNHPLFTGAMRIYSDSKVSTFLNSITHDHTSSFLNGWNHKRNHRERIYISYDSTNKHCQCGEIEMVEMGRAKDGLKLPLFNFALAHDVGNREPLFYEEYPGSIVDVSQLRYMVDTAASYGYRNVGFILDRGYFSKANISYMDRMGYGFVIMVKGMADLVSSLIEEHKGSFETNRSCSIRSHRVYAKTVVSKLYESDERQRYFHLYYSSYKESAEREQLESNIERMARIISSYEGKKVVLPASYLNYYEGFYDKGGETLLFARERGDVIERALNLCGYFVIITSAKMTAAEALDLYRSRDQGEKLFRGDKSYLGNKSLRVHSSESASGKIFVEFIALIIRSRIYCLLKDEMGNLPSKPNYMTVPAAIRELQKIEMVKGLDGLYRLDHAVTARQKKILKAFGLDEEDVRHQAIELSQILAKGV